MAPTPSMATGLAAPREPSAETTQSCTSTALSVKIRSLSWSSSRRSCARHASLTSVDASTDRLASDPAPEVALKANIRRSVRPPRSSRVPLVRNMVLTVSSLLSMRPRAQPADWSSPWTMCSNGTERMRSTSVYLS
eukprot:scaffold3854_cov251-Pinguiococcus_pyrenoidosus.AAC.7